MRLSDIKRYISDMWARERGGGDRQKPKKKKMEEE